MTTPQQKIDSEFGYDSTAQEVVAGVDLSGKLALVTGGYSGLGLETVRALAGAGAEVIVGARRVEHARQVLAPLPRVRVDELQLDDLDSVRSFAERVLADVSSIDILINNAAIMATPETRVGPGWEAQFATNHLGHFALTNLLWPALAADGGARVVAVSSLGHRRSPIRFDDLHFEHGYEKWAAYGQAKTANALFALQLDALGKDAGVRAFSLHPGGILTPLQRHLETEEMVAAGWINEDGTPSGRFQFKTPEQGASTSVWCATSPQLEGLGGVYCENCEVAEPTTDPDLPSGVRPWAVDADAAERLWTVSAELTGVDAFARAA